MTTVQRFATTAIGLVALLFALFGGTALVSAHSVQPSVTGTWQYTAYMHTSHAFFASARLQNGKVLVMGGLNGIGNDLASAELYDPATGTWSLTGSMHTARYSHTATLLNNGEVLVAGSQAGSGATPTSELFIPGNVVGHHQL